MSWNFNKLIFGLEIWKKTSKICDIRKCIESGNFLVQILELKEIRKGNLQKLNWTSNIYLEKSKWMVKRSKTICWDLDRRLKCLLFDEIFQESDINLEFSLVLRRPSQVRNSKSNSPSSSKFIPKRHQLSMTFPCVFRFLTKKTSIFDDFSLCF